MYAVIEAGGKQKRVQVGDVVHVESLGTAPGDPVVFDRVLALGQGDSLELGTPTIENARVRGTTLANGRERKIVIYTFKKRKNSNRKRRGHRQDYTAVKIEAIDA